MVWGRSRGSLKVKKSEGKSTRMGKWALGCARDGSLPAKAPEHPLVGGQNIRRDQMHSRMRYTEVPKVWEQVKKSGVRVWAVPLCIARGSRWWGLQERQFGSETGR